jgi:hypothetical protein
MQKMNGTGGLCMTCNNQPTCYHHARRGPAIYCEMFDNYVPPRPRVVEEQSPSPQVPSMAPPVEDSEHNSYKGLCTNCEHRTTCGYRRTSIGVWHCEDYE